MKLTKLCDEYNDFFHSNEQQQKFLKFETRKSRTI